MLFDALLCSASHAMPSLRLYAAACYQSCAFVSNTISAIRVRPPLQPHDPGFDLIPQRFRASTCEVTSPTNLVVASPQGKKLFVFDRVFEENIDQEGIWNYLSDSVDSFVQGYNVSILAYGQSGAGKSYTMGTAGDQQLDSTSTGDIAHTPAVAYLTLLLTESSGVVPRAARSLFEKLQGPSLPRTGIRSPQRYSTNSVPAFSSINKSQAVKSWKLTATYVEIYNEQLRDLLVPESIPQAERAQVSIREDTKGRILLTGLTQIPVNSVDDVLHALQFGSSIRQTDSTAINEQSSRSHAVFSLNLVQNKTASSAAAAAAAAATQVRDKRLSIPLEAMNATSETNIIIESKLHFVDLAGSERLKNTGAQGDRAKEGISINAGLASLGKVISQLSSRQAGGYVSYRDSRLTRLLQDSLGGNAITYMVACVTPAEFHLSETLNTVTYAQRARAIQSKPEIQQTHETKDDPARIQRLQAEIAFLREQITHERSSDQRGPANEDRVGGRRETELQNQLLDMQESYNALSQRHAKLVAELSKARHDTDDNYNTNDDAALRLKDAIGESAMERLQRSNSLSQAVEQVVVEYEKTIQSLEGSLSNTRSSLSNSESTLMERESKIAYMESLAQQLQSRLQKASDRESNNDAYLRDLETQIEGATSSEEKSASLITSLRKEIARVKEHESNTEEYVSTLEERLAEAEQDQELMQREIDRLEHVIERQRSIGRLDNLLSELDGIKKTEIDAKAGLKQTNGHGRDVNAQEAINGDRTHVATAKSEPEGLEDRAATPRGETIPEDGVGETPSITNGHTANSDTQSESTGYQGLTKAASRPVTRDEQQAAQSNFMADKLETITQELFELRGDHESALSEKQEIQRKYENVLQILAKLQDGDDDDDDEDSDDAHANDSHNKEQQISADSARPQSFLAHAGVNLKSEMVDGQEPTSSSRSLESGLSSSRRGMPTLAEELNKSGNRMSTTSAGDFEDGSAESSPVKQHQAYVHAVDPAEVPLPDEDPFLVGELELLHSMHREQQERVKELSMSYAQLQQHHQETLGQVETLKAEVSRSYTSLRASSPALRSPTLRRKLSQDLVSSMTSTDKTTRSFASLRNIALDNFEKNIDVRQNFELHLNTIMTELHDQRHRVEAMDAEMQNSRREMEMKQQMISGLTRERTSLQASTGVDITVVGQMQSKLEQSEQQLRGLHETHAGKEKEWQGKLELLRTQLEQHKAAVTGDADATAGAGQQFRGIDSGDTASPQAEHDTQIIHLEKELASSEAKHNDSLHSMKTSEAALLATITALETAKTENERAFRDLNARHSESVSTLARERELHQQTVTSLQKQIDEYMSASNSHVEQLSRLERSHSSILQQVDEQSKSRTLTEKELQTHRGLVSNLESQLDSHKATLAVHEANLENLLINLKTSHADEVAKLKDDAAVADREARDKYTALVKENGNVVENLVEQHKSALSNLKQDLDRKQEDLDELLGSASTHLGHETDVGRFHGHLADALSQRNGGDGEWREEPTQVDADHGVTTAEVQALQAKCADMENRVAELMAINAETIQSLEAVTQEEVKSSRLVQELEEQITNNYDEHQDANKRLSAMQERHVQLEEAYSAKNEMEKELGDARLKISLLEVRCSLILDLQFFWY